MQINLIQVIIGFRRKPVLEDIDLISRHKGQIKYVYNLINAIAVKIPQQAIDALRRNPNIEYIELDAKVFKHDYQTNYFTNETNKIIGDTYEMKVLQQIVPWGIEKIGAHLIHPYTKGYSINIAVIDTGIDYTHPDLSSNYKGGYNFILNNNDPMDDNSHGTHVAGTIAAADNNFGVLGIVPESFIYGVKVLDSVGSGYTSDVIAGIQWSVNNNMRIANMSFGSKIQSRSLKNACDNAYNKGLLLIAAAGNVGNKLGTGNNIDYPARYDSVIAIGATDIDNNRAIFSSTGPSLELAAPGVNILSTLPNNSYGIASGTSMASPHVAGTAALILAYNPSFSNVQTRVRMQVTATNLGNKNWYGYGLVNAYKSIFTFK